VRICEVGRLEAEGASIPIHLLNEVLHRLVRRDAPLVHIVLSVVIVLVLLVLAFSAILAAVLLLCVDRAASDRWSACLAGLTVLLIILVPRSNLKQVLSKVLCETYARIITTR
jgi:hypothetical protein